MPVIERKLPNYNLQKHKQTRIAIADAEPPWLEISYTRRSYGLSTREYIDHITLYGLEIADLYELLTEFLAEHSLTTLTPPKEEQT